MVHFLFAPILSFYDTQLYRKALQSGFGAGFIYLFYLTSLFSLLVLLFCQLFLVPFAIHFTNWLVEVTPEIIITPNGIRTDNEQPYLAEHPVFGPLYLMDTSKEASELVNHPSNARILIGKKDFIINSGERNRARPYSLRTAMLKSHEAGQAIRITKEDMSKLAKHFQSRIIPVILLLLAPIFFTWKLLIVLFYSLIASLFNFFRKEKFQYRNLFSLSCYAISPVTVLQIAHLSIPGVYFNLNFLFAFGLTVFYLLFGMFVAARNRISRSQETTAI